MVAKTVMITMGPKGKNVLLSKAFGSPIPTNDGVTVAKEIEFEDPYHNTGASIIKEAADKTNKQAGDGTTTTTTLLYGIANEGQRYIRAGVNPFALSKGLHKGVNKIIEELQKRATPVSDKNEIKQLLVRDSSQRDSTVNVVLNDGDAVLFGIGQRFLAAVERQPHLGARVAGGGVAHQRNAICNRCAHCADMFA